MKKLLIELFCRKLLFESSSFLYLKHLQKSLLHFFVLMLLNLDIRGEIVSLNLYKDLGCKKILLIYFAGYFSSFKILKGAVIRLKKLPEICKYSSKS